MNTSVSFEIAKLLKEKEFDNITDLIYMTNHTTEVLFENINQLRHSDGNNPFCSAPTIAEVVMWLYEKHGIWIGVNNQLPRNEKRFEGYVSKMILPPYDPKKLSMYLHLTDLYTTPTEAYEAAILYTLNNLI